jgi:hypothetical protein
MLNPSAIVVLIIGSIVLYGLLGYFLSVALRSKKRTREESSGQRRES